MKQVIVYGLIVLFASCSSAPKDTIFWVNSYQVDCVGVGPMKCMLVKKTADINEGEWQNFYDKIAGFDYEPGYIYKLSVKEEQRENVPADASSIKYTLVSVLEKTPDQKIALSGSWSATAIRGAEIQLPEFRGVPAQRPSLSIDYFEMQVNGLDGCNRFSGKIESIGETSLQFGPLATTQMMCPDMSVADAFSSAMNDVKGYKLDGDLLTLLDESGVELLVFSRALDAKVLLHDIWAVERMEDMDLISIENRPTLEINSKEMTAMGTDGCNNFRGKLSKLNNSEIVFGPLAGTKKMCPDMTISQKFNLLIGSVRSYTIHEGILSLYGSDNQLLIQLRKID